jgi:hypothetical protein
MMAPPTRHRVAVACLAIFGLAGFGGCRSNPAGPSSFVPPEIGSRVVRPGTSSPEDMLRALEQIHTLRSFDQYRGLFTEDYRFVFAATDSAGNDYRATPWTLEDELTYAGHVFVGGHPTLLPASSIQLTLDHNAVGTPDPDRPGDPAGRWYRLLRTLSAMHVEATDGTTYEISGGQAFHLVRGDSALIPEELRLRGYGRDSTRWYIRRWDDETTTTAADTITWGTFKVLYR